MPLSHHAIKGLQTVGVLAAHSKQHPMPSTTLARYIGLCVSSTEMVIRKLRSGSLLQVNRGPGGGYQLQQAVEHLSVWDVVSCFNDDGLPSRPTKKASLESEAVVGLAIQLDQELRHFLQAYPLIDVLKQLPVDELGAKDLNESNTPFHLKPFRQSTLDGVNQHGRSSDNHLGRSGAMNVVV